MFMSGQFLWPTVDVIMKLFDITLHLEPYPKTRSSTRTTPRRSYGDVLTLFNFNPETLDSTQLQSVIQYSTAKMPKSILSVNAGSSSVKLTFYTLDKPPKMIANAEVSGITSPPQKLKYTRSGKQHKEQLNESLSTGPDAFKYLLSRCFSDPELAELASSDDMEHICHRVVHGGDYSGPVEINDDTYHHLEDMEALAPLHNFSALEIIRLCRRELPSVKSVTYFDTAFHASLPVAVRTYPINQQTARANGLRRYGFHGISYSFILRSVAEFLGKDARETSLIALHIGSGASICAIKDGKSVDTSYVVGMIEGCELTT